MIEETGASTIADERLFILRKLDKDGKTVYAWRGQLEGARIIFAIPVFVDPQIAADYAEARANSRFNVIETTWTDALAIEPEQFRTHLILIERKEHIDEGSIDSPLLLRLVGS